MLILPVCILTIQDDSDRAFMERLYIDHRELMFKKANAILRNHHDAEDVINIACESLINNLQLLRGFDRCTLRSYIVSTIRNTALNYIKKRNRTRARTAPDPESALAAAASDEPEVDFHVLQQSEIEDLKWALQKLPEREMSLLQMKYVIGLHDSEIAHELGIQSASVRAYLTKARRNARRIMEERNE